MILKENPQAQPAANVEIGIWHEGEPRCQLQENIKAVELVIDTKIPIDTSYQVNGEIILTAAIIIAESYKRTGTQVEIKRRVAFKL